MDTRTCKGCGESKPANEDHFYRIARSGNLRGECIECHKTRHRRDHLRREYSLTPEDVYRILEAQGGTCALCDTDKPPGKNWHVDHCHDSGRVRGILCHNCNRALGVLGDSPAAVRNVLDYLTSPPAQEAA